MDPGTELAITKGGEMAAESIPGGVSSLMMHLLSPSSNPFSPLPAIGCILQFYVLLKTLKDVHGASKSSIVSLLISALSTGYSSATLTWDYDTGIEHRRDDPEFYGMIPDGLRGNVVFLCMILNSAMLLLVRSLSYAMLMLVNPAYVLYYVLGDGAFFFLQKAARGDIKYFANVDGLVGALVFDFIIQFIMKTVVDFTGLIQFRAAGILGATYWSASMVCAQLSCVIPQPSDLHIASTRRYSHLVHRLELLRYTSRVWGRTKPSLASQSPGCLSQASLVRAFGSSSYSFSS
jgi:hypothetical protein